MPLHPVPFMPADRRHRRPPALGLLAAAIALGASLATGTAARAAPYRPTSDDQVLERLPSRASDPRARSLVELRRRWQAAPQDVNLAVALARRYYEEVAAEGDPRYIGYAQAALAPWWNLADPPVAVRITRAILRQFSHEFDPAVADLQAAVRQTPRDLEAWAWLAAIAMVQARYDAAREACRGLLPLDGEVLGPSCGAVVDAATGRAGPAAALMEQVLTDHTDAPPEWRLWVLTRLAETQERLGRREAAEASYKAALALDITDGYLLAAYADFLLDGQRPADVLTLLRGRERSDLLLLRLAIAAKATGAPEAARWRADLQARFDAARLRGDLVHQKEEARFCLQVLGDVQRALPLARANYAVQKEPVDARVLMEAAVAAREPAAAAPALRWMRDNHFEHPRLQSLAQQLGAGQ